MKNKIAELKRDDIVAYIRLDRIEKMFLFEYGIHVDDLGESDELAMNETVPAQADLMDFATFESACEACVQWQQKFKDNDYVPPPHVVVSFCFPFVRVPVIFVGSARRNGSKRERERSR